MLVPELSQLNDIMDRSATHVRRIALVSERAMTGAYQDPQLADLFRDLQEASFDLAKDHTALVALCSRICTTP